MTDTPQHIKDLQLKIWLSKSPMERLRLTLESNAELLDFWASTHIRGKGEKGNIEPNNQLVTNSSKPVDGQL